MSDQKHHEHEHSYEAVKDITAVPRWWKSLDELDGSPDVERLRKEEFFEKPASYFDSSGWSLEGLKSSRPGPVMEAAGFVELAVKNNGGSDNGFSRRDFLKLSGAAMAFATAGCGMRPAEKIVPFVKADERVVPGVSTYYASTLRDAAGTGVLVETREGRPIKLEGNPDHPLTKGKLDVQGQAAIFNLYDPDRLNAPVKQSRGGGNQAAIPWPTADDEISKALLAANGQIVLLTGTVHGLARRKLIADFVAAFPGARHVMYDGWSAESFRSAQEKCYGANALPRYKFDRAEYVLCLNYDPFGCGYSSLEWQVGFGEKRKLRGPKQVKLVSIEPSLTLTGSNADERYRVRSGDTSKLAAAIAKALIAMMPADSVANKTDLEAALAKFTVTNIETDAGLPKGAVLKIAQDLWKNRGQGIVMGGADEGLQVLANLLNTLCGNDGKTVDAVVAPSQQNLGSYSDMLNLIADMKSGKVQVLMTWGTNPSFTLPAAAGFADAIKKVKTTISLSDRIDETGLWCDYVLPGLHDLESWGDAEPQKGLHSLTQPAIMPLYDNRAAEQSLIAFATAAKAGTLGQFAGDWRTYLMDTWRADLYSGKGFEATFDFFWSSALRDGVVNTITERDTDSRRFNPEALAVVEFPQIARTNLELVVCPSPHLRDAANANNAWLVECPDPVSKINWTNVISMSEATAKELNVSEGDILQVEVGGVKSELPAHIQVGVSDGVLATQTGWGRVQGGRVADGTGVNAFAFRALKGTKLVNGNLPVQVSKTGRNEKLPNVQGHDYTESRHILYDASLEEIIADPTAGQHGHHDLTSMWGHEWEYKGYRWGMAIDLSSCIGCNACILACQTENNIPVVGKESILRGREMHWIRIDRYYSGERANPEVAYQPMLCQHCANAPCETVCPVLATVHDDEGLNQQAYNRCVGTRYCSNNCPYKVRRFNWFEYTFAAYDEHPLELALNPDVTVREKGVMEKCTFCTQRIREAKLKAKQFDRKVQDNDLQTACQQTCPTGAITFGDMNNPESAVSKNMKNGRGFHVLEELNVRPSITYLTKVRNRPPMGGHEREAGHSGDHEAGKQPEKGAAH